MNNLKTGSFLQALRKAKGLTQADLADYFEVSAKTVSLWECGDSLPEIPMLKAVADFYDVSVDEILNGERRERKEDVKTRQANENYFYNKNMRKLNFALILSLCILALGYI
ncbi:MAG: helix-turn-helix transcriptional regulator, partial [Anaeroplasmataceae bacterium]|nr:helix-turn-helix transcriptional regulator [Anaeroplasmataceae bacterium]